MISGIQISESTFHFQFRINQGLSDNFTHILILAILQYFCTKYSVLSDRIEILRSLFPRGHEIGSEFAHDALFVANSSRTLRRKVKLGGAISTPGRDEWDLGVCEPLRELARNWLKRSMNIPLVQDIVPAYIIMRYYSLLILIINYGGRWTALFRLFGQLGGWYFIAAR